MLDRIDELVATGNTITEKQLERHRSGERTSGH